MYWIVISIQFSLETYFGFLVVLLPFFQLFRFLFILWLVLPQTQGASQIYINHISPFLVLHEGQIDSYVYTAHEKIRTLGADYLSRLLHYAKEYASHYMMSTEVRPYVQAVPEPVLVSPRFQGPPSAAGSSYIDNFFSKFKQPPTFASIDDSTIDPSSSNRTGSDQILADSSGNGASSTLWSSVFKAGAAAIQSSMLLPKVSEGLNLAAPGKAGSFGSILNQLDYQLPTSNASATTPQATPKVPTASTTGRENTLAKNRNISSTPNSERSLSQSPSTFSLNSDAEFEFVKYDDSVAAPFDTNNDESESLLKKGHAKPPVVQRNISWFGWSKATATADEDSFPSKPVKLD